MKKEQKPTEVGRKKAIIVALLTVALILLSIILILSFQKGDLLAPGDQGVPRILVGRYFIFI